MTYVPYDTWIYRDGYTKRPAEKKDFHIEAWNGTQYSVKLMHEKDDGSRQMYELCRGGPPIHSGPVLPGGPMPTAAKMVLSRSTGRNPFACGPHPCRKSAIKIGATQQPA